MFTFTAAQVLINPESRLVPVGNDVVFSCKFSNVTHPYWKVNATEASNNYNKNLIRMRGFNPETVTINGISTLTLRVNGSYTGINNTKIQCKSLSEIESHNATLLTIASK